MLNLPVASPELKLPLQSVFHGELKVLSPQFSFSPQLNFLFGSSPPDIRQSIKLVSKTNNDGIAQVDLAEQNFDYCFRGENRERLVNKFRFVKRDEVRRYSNEVFDSKTENFMVESQEGRPVRLFHSAKLFVNGFLARERIDLYQFEIQQHYSFY